MARSCRIFGRLWDPLGTILARGNPSSEAPKAVGFFGNIDLDGPEAIWTLSLEFLAQNWMLSHDLLAQKMENVCQFLCFWQSWNFGRAGILASSRALCLLEFSWEFSEVIEFDRSGDAWVLV